MLRLIVLYIRFYYICAAVPSTFIYTYTGIRTASVSIKFRHIHTHIYAYVYVYLGQRLGRERRKFLVIHLYLNSALMRFLAYIYWLNSYSWKTWNDMRQLETRLYHVIYSLFVLGLAKLYMFQNRYYIVIKVWKWRICSIRHKKMLFRKNSSKENTKNCVLYFGRRGNESILFMRHA